MGKKLRNKPLVEALLELKWKLEEVAPGSGALHDPVYPLFVGRLHELVKPVYPHVEPLPTVHMPDELTPQVVKYRFRSAKAEWPLIQVGPGVATLNFTDTYHWDSFLAAAERFYRALLDSYLVPGITERPEFMSVLLRYINAVEFDPGGNDTLQFLQSRLHTQVAPPDKIGRAEEVVGGPDGFQLLLTYQLRRPVAAGTIHLSNGAKEGKPALILDLNIMSSRKECPQDPDSFRGWLTAAHDIAEKWFFALVEGELERRYE